MPPLLEPHPSWKFIPLFFLFFFFLSFFFPLFFFPFSLSLRPEEPSNCAKFTVTHEARITKCVVQRHWFLWLIISYNWPCSNIFSFPSEPAYQAALNAAPGEGAALGRTPRLRSAERGGAREGASGERERRDPRSETVSSNDPHLRAGSSSSRTAPRSATWSQLCRSEGPPKFSISLILGAYALRKKKEFSWDSRYFYLWDRGIANGKRLEQNKSKERKKNDLTRSKAPFGNFKTNTLLLLKALIFSCSFKKEP